jgi:hypothetical protein
MKLKTLTFVLFFPIIMGIFFHACCGPLTSFFVIKEVFFSFGEKIEKDSLFREPAYIFLDYDASLTVSVNPFLNDAYAWSCPGNEGERGLKDATVSAMTVTTLFDYDTKYPKGSSINDILIMDSGTTIDDFIKNQVKNESTLDFYGHSFRILHTKEGAAKLSDAQKQPLQLNIKMELSDGTVFNAKTGFVYF